MATSYTLLSDWRAGRCTNTAEVRLWEARNINKAVNPCARICWCGSTAQIQKTSHKPKYLLSDAPLYIGFNDDGTSFEKLSTTVRTIPMELFRFQPYNQILELANTARQLRDVMGELSAIRSTMTDRILGAQCVMITLRLERDVNVCVSMFNSLAVALQNIFDSYRREPTVILVISVNPKKVGVNIVFDFAFLALEHRWWDRPVSVFIKGGSLTKNLSPLPFLSLTSLSSLLTLSDPGTISPTRQGEQSKLIESGTMHCLCHLADAQYVKVSPLILIVEGKNTEDQLKIATNSLVSYATVTV
ncbi:unnamed protein product [Eruca vesicaria subsp. sativa]|uniref:Uncharacterized protein n=1 Tax=Eruca vesicaria subsp. sativa TaxID=29727 RepID=A0ABC8JMS3_ERUVS|nr:unnamed protein product [Eruca vesicaria subsp. sativa]